jgi:hypothetical protein
MWFSSGTPVSSKNKIYLTRYNLIIVESGVKHHQTNKPTEKHTPRGFFSISEEACGPTQDVGAEFLDGEFSEEDVELELSVFTHEVRV